MCNEEIQEKREDTVKVEIDKPVTDVNDAIASNNSGYLMENKTFSINLMGSPGSGKTTVIENLASVFGPDNVAVIQGDLESDVDKKRLEKLGIDCYQINTHSGCHLNAQMVNRALMELKLKNKEYLIIENVGNLVCPAGVRIGQHMNIVVSSTTEGSDKPRKYPVIFHDADIVLIHKMDLAEAVEFSEYNYVEDITKINPKARIFRTSKKEQGSFKEVAHHIEHQRHHLFGHLHSH
jgi:hydrogenase nickel incorporation protein HypB